MRSTQKIVASDPLSVRNGNFSCRACETTKQLFIDGLGMYVIKTVANVCTMYFLSASETSNSSVRQSSMELRKVGIGNGLGSS